MIQGNDKALIFTSTKEACLAACLNEASVIVIDIVEVHIRLFRQILGNIGTDRNKSSYIWQKKAWIKYERTTKYSVEIFPPSAHITKERESEGKFHSDFCSGCRIPLNPCFNEVRIDGMNSKLACKKFKQKDITIQNWRLWGIRIDNSLWRFPLPLLLCSCGAFSVEISKLASKLRHAFDFGLLKTSVEFRFSHFAEELCVPFCRVQLRDPPVPPGGRWPADAARRSAKVQAHADAGRGLLREPMHDGWG